MIVVVDASVLVKWYVDEEDSIQAQHLIDRRFELHAPELMVAEFGNILWKKCRSNDIDEHVAHSAIESLRSRDVVSHSNDALIKAALIGALESGQSVYDWIYLALAISLDCRFVTADRKFFLAMRNTPFNDRFVWIANISSSLG